MLTSLLGSNPIVIPTASAGYVLAGTIYVLHVHPPSQNICTFGLLQITFDRSPYLKIL
jgi:hypothetical protein